MSEIVKVVRILRRKTGVGLPSVRPTFVHIPKTAGSALGRMLRTAFWAQPELVVVTEEDERRALLMPQDEFDRYAIYRGHFGPAFADRVSRPFVFTFLRDPIERAISGYFYARSKGHPLPSLAEYLELAETQNTMTRQLCGRPDRTAAAIEALSVMNFVGLTERFDADSQKLFALLGHPHVSVLTHNVAHARVALSDLSREVRSLLMRNTEADREVYEWARTRQTAR